MQDKDLISSLEDAKSLSRTVTEKMRVGAETQSIIQASAERYRSVAARGALLFFTMSALDKVNAFYKFSLNAFVVVFIRGIDLVDGPVARPKSKLVQAARAVGSVKGKLQVGQECWVVLSPEPWESTFCDVWSAAAVAGGACSFHDMCHLLC